MFRLIKIISILTGPLILKKHKGIWGLKDNICKSKSFKQKLFLIIYEKYLTKKGSWIGYDTVFKNTPLFPHGILGVFISREAIIGKNCIIFHQVTIGSNTLRDSKIGSPIIGDNVYIGAGAKIIGAVKIGNNCRIGANCTVYKDMPDNSVAVNAPTRIIKKEDQLDNRFFTLRENNEGIKSWYFYDQGNWIPE